MVAAAGVRVLVVFVVVIGPVGVEGMEKNGAIAEVTARRERFCCLLCDTLFQLLQLG
jgi:hypothetical protein